MRDNSELPTTQQPLVKVYVLLNDDNQFTFMGSGYIEIVTDALQFQYEHYIEVTNSDDTKDMFLRSRLQANNVYQRQKNTVITWSDPEQQIKNDIGISFESNEACDMFWRLLCSKIGKNYLEINGRQKLQMPNEKNVRHLLEKIKVSYNLVAYHVINSVEFMNAFWETLDYLNKNPQPIKGITVLRELLSQFDPKIMAIFLSDDHFDHFLEVYEYEANVKFRESYKKTQTANEIVELKKVVKKTIELSLRAKFVRQFVIDHSKDFMMESMLNQVAKENLIQALISMLNQNCIGKIVEIFNASKDEEKGKRTTTITRILSFFLQCVWSLRIYHPDNLKGMFITAFYSSGMLRILAEMLNDGYHKALEILTCLAVLDNKLFLTEFTNDYRADPAKSILRIIGIQFATNPNPEFASETVSFLKSLGVLIQSNKTMFQFFNKTTIYTIFACCKHSERILPLIIVCICDLGALRPVFEQISNFKYFQVIAGKIEKKQISKSELLDVVRIIRLVLEQFKGENTETLKFASTQIVKSKLFQLCLIYLKENLHHNNLLVSSLISTLELISKLKFNQFTQVVQQFQFGDISKKNGASITLLLEKIKQIKEEQVKMEDENDILLHGFGKKRVHKTILDNQEEEKYLQQEQQEIEEESTYSQNIKKQEQMLKKLMEIRSQISSKEKNGEGESTKEALRERSDKLKARKKQDDTIGFDFSEFSPE